MRLEKQLNLCKRKLAYQLFTEYVQNNAPKTPSVHLKKITSVMWRGLDNVTVSDHIKDNYITKIQHKTNFR